MSDVGSQISGGNSAAQDSRATEPQEIRQPADDFDFRAMHANIGSLLSKQIFFLGGSAKSGTTWLQVLLDAHPQVSCSGENHFVNLLSPGLKKALEEYNRIILDPRGNTAYQLGKEPEIFGADGFRYVVVTAMLTILLAQAKGKPVLALGDKTTHNVRAFGALSTWLPGSKCIHIVRDPRDSAVSGWHHINRIFPQDARERFPGIYDYVKHYADVWSWEVGRGVEVGSEKPDRYLEVRYEELVRRPVPILRGAFRFLGVDDDEPIARQCVEAAAFEKLSRGRKPGEEDTRSFFRKGVVGDWENHLDTMSRDYILAKCGDLMKRFGYL